MQFDVLYKYGTGGGDISPGFLGILNPKATLEAFD